MKKRALIALILAFLAVPAIAVLPEQDLRSTLRVLHQELKGAVRNTQNRESVRSRIADNQKELLKLIEKSNELSVIMYSQQRGNTFELTYALNSATQQYEDFNAQKIPYNEIITTMQDDWTRYRRLSQALAKIPPKKDDLELPVITLLDSAGFVMDSILLSLPSFAVGDTSLVMDKETELLRDSCMVLTDQLVAYYSDRMSELDENNSYYEETNALLKEAYDYAQERYRQVQRQVFLEGSRKYVDILKNWSRNYQRARREMAEKYGFRTFRTSDGSFSYWKGPIVWMFSFIMLAALLLSILLSNLIVRITIRWVPWFRTPHFQENKGMYITMAGIVLFFVFCMVFGAADADGENFFEMASEMMAEFAALLGAVFLSIYIRSDQGERRKALRVYLPMIALSFVVIFFRITFIPDSALNLVFPTLALLFTVWQLVMNIVKTKSVARIDRAFVWVTFVVMAAISVISWNGLVMMSLLVCIWWTFQMMVLQLVVAAGVIVIRHYERKFKSRQLAYRKKHPNLPLSSEKGAFIEVTWPYDLFSMLLLPLLSIWSIPLSINLSCRVFNLNNVASDVFMSSFVHVEKYIDASLFKLLMVISLFFLFRFLVYAIKAFYRVWRTRATLRKMKDPAMFKDSDINFNLANNIIALVGWGIYVIVAFVMLEIPTSALTIVTTGLATGIGFAMKDVLNNFFYGVQLMGGRVRVGDTIECDGIRGKVESLSYQSTQVASEDGSIIAFTNTALFNKNFKNLTRNHQYEMINFLVGVKYGTDIAKARQVIRDALDPLLVKDKYGRDLVDMKKGIMIRLRNFADSAIEMQVVLYAAVEVHYSFAASAKEAIYNAFAANGIEIPFPQRDVYIKEAPKKE